MRLLQRGRLLSTQYAIRSPDPRTVARRASSTSASCGSTGPPSSTWSASRSSSRGSTASTGWSCATGGSSRSRPTTARGSSDSRACRARRRGDSSPREAERPRSFPSGTPRESGSRSPSWSNPGSKGKSPSRSSPRACSSGRNASLVTGGPPPRARWSARERTLYSIRREALRISTATSGPGRTSPEAPSLRRRARPARPGGGERNRQDAPVRRRVARRARRGPPDGRGRPDDDRVTGLAIPDRLPVSRHRRVHRRGPAAHVRQDTDRPHSRALTRGCADPAPLDAAGVLRGIAPPASRLGQLRLRAARKDYVTPAGFRVAPALELSPSLRFRSLPAATEP